MGSEIGKPCKERHIEVAVHGTARIKSIEVVKNNTTVLTQPGTGFDETLGFTDGPSLETDYYYVRVIQQDGHIAWSSPIWAESRVRGRSTA
jgi:hypothetical protein